MPGEVKFKDVITFFANSWGPAIESLHSQKGGIVGDFLTAVLEAVRDLPTNEVHSLLSIYAYILYTLWLVISVGFRFSWILCTVLIHKNY